MFGNEKQRSLYSLFAEAAQCHPHSIATIYDDGNDVTIATYQEVLKASGVIAELLTEVGLKDVAVGVYSMVVPEILNIILGILQVSCCFVPLDPKAPQHINTHVISSIGLQMVLVQSTHLNEFYEAIGLQWDLQICPASSSSELKGLGFVLIQVDHTEVNKHQDQSLSSCKNVAYVMHTSGTTGMPKVIRVPHQCIVPNILHLRDILNISNYDVIFNAATLTFDTSIVEIFLALSQGASLLMVPTAVKLMPRRLMGTLMRNHVTVVQATPTLIRKFDPSLLRNYLFRANSSLRLMIFGGEPCPTPAMIGQWRDSRNTTTFCNIYGITEVSCWASLYRILDEDIRNAVNESVPIGEPLAETFIEVRDTHGNTVSQGSGTVFIGGSQRICHLDDEEPSADSQAVMRDTGDLVHITDRGLLYMGRSDDQIKRHGKRITLSQIQQSVEMLDSVSSCATVLNDQQQLILFCVPTNNQVSPIPQCISHPHPFLSQVKDVVPLHGVPDSAFWVGSLPVTLHGKLDRQRLCKIAKDLESDMESVECGNVKDKFRELWQNDLTHNAAIADNSNFLQLGGDSFQAVQMASKVELMCRIHLPDFVDILLHKCFTDVAPYVQSCLSAQNQSANSAKSGVAERGNPKQQSGAISAPKEQSTTADTVLPSYQADTVSDDVCCHPCTCCYVAISRASQVTKCTQRIARLGQTIVQSADDSVLPWKPDTFKSRWKYDTGKCVDASPLIVKWRSQTVMYIGSHSHKFAAVSMETGAALWESTLGDRIESSACLSTCGKFVIVGCYDGHVYFLDSGTGSVYWKYKTSGTVKSSPVADSESSLVYVGSHDQYLHALCVKDKTCVWQIHCGGGSVFSSPAISYQTQCVYVGTLSGHLLAINKNTGDLQWRYQCPKPIFSSPAVSATGVIVGCADGSLYCVSHNGNKLWTFETQAPIFSSPCMVTKDCNLPITDIVVFGSHDEHVYCIDQTTGKLLWKTKLNSQVYATPFIFKGERLRKKLNEEVDCGSQDMKRQTFGEIDESSTEEPYRKYVRVNETVIQGITHATLRLVDDQDKNLKEIGQRLNVNPIGESDNESSTDEPYRKYVRVNETVIQGITHATLRLVDDDKKTLEVTGRRSKINPIGESGAYHETTAFSKSQRPISTNIKSSHDVKRISGNSETSDAASGDEEPHCSDISEDVFIAAACTCGTLAILDSCTGNVIASYELPGEVFSSPIVDGNQVVIGCRDDFVYCLQFA